MTTRSLVHWIVEITYTKIYINIYRKEGNSLSKATPSCFFTLQFWGFTEGRYKWHVQISSSMLGRLSKEDMLTFSKLPEDLGEERDRSINNLFLNTMFGLAKVLKQPHSNQQWKGQILSLSSKFRKWWRTNFFFLCGDFKGLERNWPMLPSWSHFNSEGWDHPTGIFCVLLRKQIEQIKLEEHRSSVHYFL